MPRSHLPQTCAVLLALFLTACAPPPALKQVWLVNADSGILHTVNNNQVTDALAVEAAPWDVALGPDAVWVSTNQTIYRLDPEKKAEVAHWAVEDGYALSLVARADAVWVLISPTPNLFNLQDAPTNAQVLRIDPATNTIAATIAITSSHLEKLVADDTSVWVSAMDVVPGGPPNLRILRLDPITNAIAETVPLDFVPADLALGFGKLWITTDSSPKGNGLAWVDLATHQLGWAALGGTSDRVAIGAGTVWVTDKNEGYVYSVDPTLGVQAAGSPLPAPSLSLAVNDTGLWVLTYQGLERQLVRLNPQTAAVETTIPLHSQAWKVLLAP